MGSGSTFIPYTLVVMASVCFFSGLAIISHEGVRSHGETRNYNVDAR